MNDAPRRSSWPWRWLLAAVLLIAPAVIGFDRWFAEQTRLARLQVEYAAAVKVRHRFEQEVSLPDTSERTLRQLLNDFEKKTGIAVTWNEEGYEMQRWLQLPLGCQLPPLPVCDWLDTVGELRGFTWQVKTDGAVLLNGKFRGEDSYWQNYPIPANLTVEISPGGITTFQSLRGHLRTQRFLARLNAACASAADRDSSPGMNEAAGEPIWLDGEQQHFRESIFASAICCSTTRSTTFTCGSLKNSSSSCCENSVTASASRYPRSPATAVFRNRNRFDLISLRQERFP